LLALQVVVLDPYVVLRRIAQPGNLCIRQGPQFFHWPTYVQETAFQRLARRDEAADTDHGTVFNDDVVHHNAAHADQAFVADAAAMQEYRVANGNVIADVQGRTLRFLRRLVRYMDIVKYINKNICIELDILTNSEASCKLIF
jgi:hypothetical protein